MYVSAWTVSAELCCFAYSRDKAAFSLEATYTRLLRPRAIVKRV